MSQHFAVSISNGWIIIKKLSNLVFQTYAVYIDNRLVANYYGGNTFCLQIRYPVRQIDVIGYQYNNGYITPVGERFFAQVPGRERDFKPGDILVASDNVKQEYTGYMGHSAIIVDENNLIESPGGYPAIEKDSIEQFLEKHPIHAQFRPKDSDMGKEAAAYAENYLKEYKKNLEEGTKKPTFSFDLSQTLEDPWEYIYCSKLVWLCYAKGANYELENDHLWYSPEDLYTDLKGNQDFEKIYDNEVKFYVDT